MPAICQFWAHCHPWLLSPTCSATCPSSLCIWIERLLTAPLRSELLDGKEIEEKLVSCPQVRQIKWSKSFKWILFEIKWLLSSIGFHSCRVRLDWFIQGLLSFWIRSLLSSRQNLLLRGASLSNCFFSSLPFFVLLFVDPIFPEGAQGKGQSFVALRQRHLHNIQDESRKALSNVTFWIPNHILEAQNPMFFYFLFEPQATII